MGNTQSVNDRRASHRLSKPRTKATNSLETTEVRNPIHQTSLPVSTQYSKQASGCKTRSRRASLLRSISVHSARRDRSSTSESIDAIEPVPPLNVSTVLLAQQEKNLQLSSQIPQVPSPHSRASLESDINNAVSSRRASVAGSSRRNSIGGVYVPIRRRSLAIPGVATRQGASANIKGHREQQDALTQVTRKDYLLAVSTPALISNDPFNEALIPGIPMTRSLTPSDQEYCQTGAFKLGTLRVVNGGVSPGSSFVDPDISISTEHNNYFDNITNSTQYQTHGSEPNSSGGNAAQGRASSNDSDIPPPVPPKSSTYTPKLPSTVKSPKAPPKMHERYNKLVDRQPSSREGDSGFESDESPVDENTSLQEELLVPHLVIRKPQVAISKAATAEPTSDYFETRNGFTKGMSSPECLPSPLAKTDSGYSSNISLRSFTERDSLKRVISSQFNGDESLKFGTDERAILWRPTDKPLSPTSIASASEAQSFGTQYPQSPRPTRRHSEIASQEIDNCSRLLYYSESHLSTAAPSLTQRYFEAGYSGTHVRSRPSISSGSGRVPVRNYSKIHSRQSSGNHSPVNEHVATQNSQISQYWDNPELQGSYEQMTSSNVAYVQYRLQSDQLQKPRSFSITRSPARRSFSHYHQDNHTTLGHTQSLAEFPRPRYQVQQDVANFSRVTMQQPVRSTGLPYTRALRLEAQSCQEDSYHPVHTQHHPSPNGLQIQC